MYGMARPKKHTGRLYQRIAPELLARLDAWCATAGMKRAEVVRLAIERIIESKAP